MKIEFIEGLGTRNYTYDALGRIVTQKDALGTLRYRYDENGNVLSVSEAKLGEQTKSVTRIYDALNRVISVTDYNGNTVKYGYDELGNRISLTYPGGEIVRYSYDKCGNMLSATGADGSRTTYSYDANSRLIRQNRPDGSVETYTYDAAGQLIRQEDKTAAGEEIHTFTYAYDTSGNIIEKTGEAAGDHSLTPQAVMTYDADNRMVSYNEETVTYDVNGNMLRGPLNGRMADFTYDCRNRLVKVETEGGAVTEYAYDAENVRLWEISGDRKTVYVTDREAEYSQLLSETTYEQLFGSEVQTTQKTYIYGRGLIGSKDGSNLENLYYHYNNIGSTTEVTSDEGVIVYRFAYDTYGELIGITDENGESLLTGSSVLSQILAKIDVRFLYNGQFGIETEDNGLYYMRARYYNPQIKRFINRDILEGDITDSQTLNRYSYVLGNPVSLTDPFGLCAADYLSNAGHTFFDCLGFFLDPADSINAVWYMAEGNYLMAGASSIGMIPVIGPFAGKGGREVIQEGGQRATVETAEEIIEDSTRAAAEREAAQQAQEYATKNASGNAGKGDTGKGNSGKGDSDSGNSSRNDPGNNTPGKTDPASAAAGAAGAAGTAGKGGANAATSAGSKADAGKSNVGGKTSGKGGLDGVQSKFNKLLNSDYYKNNPGYDCSEIATDFYDAAGQQGVIYRIEGKNGVINGYEYGKVYDFEYHEVYSDGVYIYDPRYKNTPVLKDDYFKALKDINPDGFDVFTIQ